MATITTEGYRGIVVVRGRPYVLEHRHIMAQHLGRPLRKDEIVHHKDGNRLNNNLENLEVLSPSQHSLLHHSKGGGGSPPAVNADRIECTQGHLFIPENTYVYYWKGKAHRACRTCHRMEALARWRKRRDAARLQAECSW